MPNVQTLELTIRLDSDVAIVQQIANSLRAALVAGELAPGDALPSSRTLARDLGVHFNTVAQAYRMLEAEGWLELKRRAGTIVRERSRPALGEEERLALVDGFRKQLRDLCARFQALGIGHEALDSVLKDSIETRRSSS